MSNNLSPEMIERLRTKAREDFYFFAKGVLGFDLLTAHIHLPICRLLQDPTNTRLKIVLPRSWLKSTIGSIAYPVWRAIRDPEVRVLIVQNSHDNARKKLAVIRRIFEGNALFRTLFPELLPTKESVWTADSLCINRKSQNAESTFECAGTRTKLTSRHYNVIIEDDTVSPDLDDVTESGVLLPTKEDVEQAIGWHRLAMPLLVDPMTDQLLIIGTRWFEKDLISWNDEHEPHYRTYRRAVREDAEGNACETGEITYPERFNDEMLKQLESGMGPYLFSCLYLNKPVAAGTMAFQAEWFRYYEVPPRDVACFTTVDCGSAAEDVQNGAPDYSVVMTAGKDMVTGRIFVLDYFRERCTPSELVAAIFRHVRMYSPIKVGIESWAYQSSLVYWCRERMRDENLYFLVEGLKRVKQKKELRILGLQPLVKNGTLWFHRRHTLLVNELLAQSLDRGSLSANDDLADTLSMQLQFWPLTLSKAEEEHDNASNDPFRFEYTQRELWDRARRAKSESYHAWRNVD